MSGASNATIARRILRMKKGTARPHEKKMLAMLACRRMATEYKEGAWPTRFHKLEYAVVCQAIEDIDSRDPEENSKSDLKRGYLQDSLDAIGLARSQFYDILAGTRLWVRPTRTQWKMFHRPYTIGERL